jgi:hypothetical protein
MFCIRRKNHGNFVHSITWPNGVEILVLYLGSIIVMRVRMQATLAGLCEFWKRRCFLKQVTTLPLHVLSSSQMFKSVTSLSTL